MHESWMHARMDEGAWPRIDVLAEITRVHVRGLSRFVPSLFFRRCILRLCSVSRALPLIPTCIRLVLPILLLLRMHAVGDAVGLAVGVDVGERMLCCRRLFHRPPTPCLLRGVGSAAFQSAPDGRGRNGCGNRRWHGGGGAHGKCRLSMTVAAVTIVIVAAAVTRAGVAPWSKRRRERQATSQSCEHFRSADALCGHWGCGRHGCCDDRMCTNRGGRHTPLLPMLSRVSPRAREPHRAKRWGGGGDSKWVWPAEVLREEVKTRGDEKSKTRLGSGEIDHVLLKLSTFRRQFFESSHCSCWFPITQCCCCLSYACHVVSGSACQPRLMSRA